MKLGILIFCFLFVSTTLARNNSQLHLLTGDARKEVVTNLKKQTGSLFSVKNRKFQRVSKLLSRGDKDSKKKAVVILESILKEPASNAIKAESLYLLGTTYASLENFKDAIRYLEESIHYNEIGYHRFENTLILIAQLNLILKNNKKAKDYLLSYFSISEESKPRPYMFLATIHYLEKDLKEALRLVNKAILLSKTPEKSHLSFAVSLHFEFKEYDKAEEVLKRLLTLYPDSQAQWEQLAITQYNKEQQDHTLAVMQVASKIKPLDKEASVIQHVSLLAEKGIPYLAAQNLKKSLESKRLKSTPKHLEMLGDFWMQSREEDLAIDSYKQATQEEKEEGRIFVKLGRLYLFKDKFKKSIELMKQGLKVGRLEDKDEVYFQIAWSYYSLKNYKRAIEYFTKAIELGGDYEIPARKWIRQIQQNHQT